MRVLAIVFFLFISGNFGEDNLVTIVPSQSSTVLNGAVYFNQPSFFVKDSNIKRCRFTVDNSEFVSCSSLITLDGMRSELFDYQFLTPPGPLKLKNSTFAFGSIKYNYLNNVDPTVTSRFSLITDEDWNIHKYTEYFKEEPSFPNFPDIEYSISLIGEPDIYKSTSEASLYILGGAKYYKTNKTIQMTNSFSSYSFNKSRWDDLSDKLPKDYEPIAGHKMVNINNEKLVVLGGYRTNNYTFDGNLTAINPQFYNFKKILVFDVNEQKLEYKSTELSEEDEKMLRARKQYSCTAVHHNNNIYVYSGYYTESINSTVHLFGVLDLDNWSWRWKKIKVHSSSYKYLNNTIKFDSMLFEKYMVVVFSDITVGNLVKYLIFDLDSEEPTSGLIPNSSNLRVEPYHKITTSPESIYPEYEIIIFIWLVSTVAILMIVFLLYRYYKHNREFKGFVPRFETSQIWSDSDIKPYNNQDDFLYSESLGYTYACESIEYFDNSINTKVPEFERKKQSDWNENTVYKPLTQHSNHLFKTLSTLIRPSIQQYTQLSKASSSKNKWDPYSTY